MPSLWCAVVVEVTSWPVGWLWLVAEAMLEAELEAEMAAEVALGVRTPLLEMNSSSFSSIWEMALGKRSLYISFIKWMLVSSGNVFRKGLQTTKLAALNPHLQASIRSRGKNRKKYFKWGYPKIGPRGAQYHFCFLGFHVHLKKHIWNN